MMATTRPQLVEVVTSPMSASKAGPTTSCGAIDHAGVQGCEVTGDGLLNYAGLAFENKNAVAWWFPALHSFREQFLDERLDIVVVEAPLELSGKLAPAIKYEDRGWAVEGQLP